MYFCDTDICNFNDMFCVFRDDYGFTQEVLGELLGLSRNSISDIERGIYKPSSSVLVKFLILTGDLSIIDCGINPDLFYDLISNVEDLCNQYYNFMDHDMADKLNSLFDDLVRWYDYFIYNTDIAYEAQKKFCDLNDVPLFSPIFCWSCGFNVFLPSEHRAGRSVLYARKNHITCCPHCSRSFCD